ncbi:MAG: hypothetical protein M3Q07_22465 [Pseudobdellovibrionaceae bacterium]|uniref:hypothetical protein n=1 Tax=Oligoflexus sp. TaxID=1971216 RepID=UPI0027CB8FE2|nr:hypothetical protein [Oligoflexus sp.]MDQ3234577.1 hypothetical protein [Pseudobdellovibrionaceae bacterium]HYX33839.1 hypothetical protein [Oligoflexus sp.]
MKKTTERDRVIKLFSQYLIGSIGRRSDKSDSSGPGAKDFLTAMASWAGKGKDELVQVICHEIGTATAMVLKEPLGKLLENRKIHITIELVPHEESQKKNTRKKTSVRLEHT